MGVAGEEEPAAAPPPPGEEEPEAGDEGSGALVGDGVEAGGAGAGAAGVGAGDSGPLGRASRPPRPLARSRSGFVAVVVSCCVEPGLRLVKSEDFGFSFGLRKGLPPTP